jgi:hypothetical protein
MFLQALPCGGRHCSVGDRERSEGKKIIIINKLLLCETVNIHYPFYKKKTTI